MKTGDRVFARVDDLRVFSQPNSETIWTAIDPDTLENDYGFDDAQTPYQFEYKRSQRVGTVRDFKVDAFGVTFAQLNIEAIHHDDGHDAVWFLGKSTPARERPFTIVAWVLADDIVDESGLVTEYIPKQVTPKTDTPKTETPKTDTPKVDAPKTDTKSIFTQTDANTGGQKPNYLLYGGIAVGVILIGVGLYWAFGSKPEPTPIVQYVPQPQSMK
jgi:hypothetical protein